MAHGQMIVNETPRIWAAAIEQTGSLIVVAAQFAVAQHLYSTYIDEKPESSWLMMLWKKYRAWEARREQARIGWINRTESVEEPSFP